MKRAVELFKYPKSGLIVLRVGAETVTMTIGEWSKLIALPQKPSDADKGAE